MKTKNFILKICFLLTVLCPSLCFASDIFPFSAKNSKGVEIQVAPKENNITVLEWFNKGCPFVKKFYNSGFMQNLQEQYTKKNVAWYSINSTKEEHSDFVATGEREKHQEQVGFKNTETLYDESGVVGKKFGAKTTPHVFIFKGEELIYSGAVDESPDADSDPKAAKNHVVEILDALLKGDTVEESKTRPYGCSIKYAD